MSEYISREEFLKRIKPYDTSDNMDKSLYNFALHKMVETPNANVVEREKLDKAIKAANDNISTAFKLGLNERAYGMREILDIFIKSIGSNNDNK
jgi:hypothetical protein